MRRINYTVVIAKKTDVCRERGGPVRGLFAKVFLLWDNDAGCGLQFAFSVGKITRPG